MFTIVYYLHRKHSQTKLAEILLITSFLERMERTSLQGLLASLKTDGQPMAVGLQMDSGHWPVDVRLESKRTGARQFCLFGGGSSARCNRARAGGWTTVSIRCWPVVSPSRHVAKSDAIAREFLLVSPVRSAPRKWEQQREGTGEGDPAAATSLGAPSDSGGRGSGRGLYGLSQVGPLF